MAMMAPSGGPLKTACLQGKSRKVRGSVPFGDSDRLVCLPSDLPEGYYAGASPPLRSQIRGAASRVRRKIARLWRK
jgi:hypothetical protein